MATGYTGWGARGVNAEVRGAGILKGGGERRVLC